MLMKQNVNNDVKKDSPIGTINLDVSNTRTLVYS